MKNKTLQELQPLIIQWAKDKGITNKDFADKQRLKLLEEVGELAKAILKNDVAEISDGIGDSFIVLTILAEQLDCKFLLDLNKEDVFYEGHTTSELLQSIIYSEFNTDLLIFHTICKRLNLDLTTCCNLAWNEIKDRKGKTVDGTFVKN